MGGSNHLIVSLKEPELIKVLVVEAVRLFKENDVDIISINIHIPGDKDDTEVNPPIPPVAGTNGHDAVDKEVILRQGNYIFIKRNFQFVKLKLSEILFLEADGNYVHVVMKDKKFTVRLSLLQVIQKINYSRFARINRSSVVNVDAIQSFNKEQVEIAQYEIPIGKSYKESFFRQLLPPVIQRYDNGQSWL